MGSFLTFLIVFGILVFVHELGHFLAARFFGVRVDEFAFGFPPRIWAKKKGNTQYAINLIPIGGYVKLWGEEGEGSKDQKDNYLSKKPWQKIVILGSGVLMNFLLAYFLLVLFFTIGGKPLIPGMADHPKVINTQRVQVNDVTSGSPAEKSEIRPGDVIVEIDDKKVYTNAEVFLTIQSKAQKEEDPNYKIMVERDGRILEKSVGIFTEEIEENGKKNKYFRIGIGMEETGKVQALWYNAPIVAVSELARIVKLTLEGLGGFFGTLFSELRLDENVGGPVSIYMVTGMAAEIGFAAVVQVIIILSTTLAVINIMPFPALDGGHILLLVIEKIKGREVSQKVKNALNSVGFFLLITLIIAVTFKDVLRFGIFEGIKGWFK